MAAAELREAAKALLERADAIEAAQPAVPPAEASPEPLAPPRDEQEAAARLVALDLITRGVDRAEAERTLVESFPGCDAPALLDRLAGSA